MREPADWTIPLGTWQGIPLRLHSLFLLFGGGALYLAQLAKLVSEARHGAAAASDNLVWLTAVGLLILYLSLLAHEFCHWWVARRFGVDAPMLLIGPLGGLTEWESRDDPKAEIMTHAAGPLANLAIALIPCLATLRWCDPTIAISGLLDPLQPDGLPLGSRLSVGTLAGLAFWINWTLFVINLFPAFPFDGGRILRASVRLTRPQVGSEIAEFLVARLARLAAFGLAVTAVFVLDEPATTPVAPWFALSVLAGTVLFTGLSHERRARSAIAAAPWLATLHASPPRPALRTRAAEDREIPSDEFLESDGEPWVDDDELRTTVRETEREIARLDDPSRRREQDDERRVDEILAKLHEVGLEKLTLEERGILERASARYRQRSTRPQ
jgi:Zn-dependent protease